ncbi:MAG: adenosine deaminase [SAR324 cluster bacterium]|nr:adenosine deaminase [SAR324 cluster bacterium]
MEEFIKILPKAELHLHIEGSLEPELMFKLAERNQIELPFSSVEEVREAYEFSDLQSFLDIYYAGAGVLLQTEDFFDLTWAYLERVHRDNVKHVEIFFDPQTHTDRGVPMRTVIAGIHKALEQAKQKFDITSYLILCFLRHLSEEAAMETLQEALPFRGRIEGVGLDSAEVDFPPEIFERVFAKASEEGLRKVAHAGEEGPPEYIWQALDLLGVARIDHGVRCMEDKNLVERLLKDNMPLTVCPLSNTKLRVFDKMEDHNLKEMLDAGLCVTINSDDPAYFGGYMNDNFLATQKGLNLSRDDVIEITKNGFRASFLPQDSIDYHLRSIDKLAEKQSK